MTDKEDSESGLSFAPEASTSLLGPTVLAIPRCQSHSLPSLLLPSSTNHPAMQTSGSLFLPQAKEIPLLESPQQPSIPVLALQGEQKRRDLTCDLIYLTKYTLLLVGLGIGGGLIIWLAMRLTSTQIGNASTPLYFSSVDPEDRALCGKPVGRIRNRRVVAGEESDYAEWPWTVSRVGLFLHSCSLLILFFGQRFPWRAIKAVDGSNISVAQFSSVEALSSQLLTV